MFNIQDALYIPGFGFSVTKTKDQSLGSPEADFAALMGEVRAAQEKRKAEEEANGPFIRAELAQEDIRELATRYDPDNMTQEEYDSFLDDLIERGVLGKKDLNYIDYRGDLIPNGQYICVGQVDLLGDGGPGNFADCFKDCICSSIWTGQGGRPSLFDFASLTRPTNSNVLAWAREASLWKPEGPASILLDAENRRKEIYTVLADALDAMQRQRLTLGLA